VFVTGEPGLIELMLVIVSNMAEALGETLIDALGEKASLPLLLDEVKIRVSEGGLVGRSTPLSGDELGSIEGLGWHKHS
jgi:ethanolamine utilization protein EutA (predicted chaperonin)